MNTPTEVHGCFRDGVEGPADTFVWFGGRYGSADMDMEEFGGKEGGGW